MTTETETDDQRARALGDVQEGIPICPGSYENWILWRHVASEFVGCPLCAFNRHILNPATHDVESAAREAERYRLWREDMKREYSYPLAR
jgi:hypothetical protein